MKLGFILAIMAGSLAQAQMRGGMGGSPSSNPNDNYMRMLLGYGSGGMMGSGMGFGMTGDLAVGADGTAYAIRAIASSSSMMGSSSSQAWQYELDAISPANGSVLWRLQISGGRISQPVLTTDGLILLTVDDYQMFQPNLLTGGWMMNSNQSQSTGGHLLVISHTATSAAVAVKIAIASDMLSAPLLAANPAGGYLIYVVGFDVTSMQTSSPSSISPPKKTLYAYTSGGALKFSVNLSQ